MDDTSTKKPHPDSHQFDSVEAGEAAVMKQFMLPAALQHVSRQKGQLSLDSIKQFVDDYLRDAGDPQDPLECILVEQAALAHHQIMYLQVKAATAKAAGEISIYISAAARLMAELRRVILAIQAYRGRDKPKSSVVTYRIQQQNIAQGDAKQDVAFNTDSEGESVHMKCRDSELTSNSVNKEGSHRASERFTPEEPRLRSRRKTQSAKA